MKLQKSMMQIAWMYLIITMIWPHNFIFSAEIDSLFNQGNEHYSLGEYEMAINNYENCLQLSQSTALHFNIGNAWYQIDEVGKAILHFEKALALNPGYPEAQANLKFVRENSDLALPEYSWVSRLAQTLSLSTWCWIGAVSFWAVIALITLKRGNFIQYDRTLVSSIYSYLTKWSAHRSRRNTNTHSLVFIITFRAFCRCCAPATAGPTPFRSTSPRISTAWGRPFTRKTRNCSRATRTAPATSGCSVTARRRP